MTRQREISWRFYQNKRVSLLLSVLNFEIQREKRERVGEGYKIAMWNSRDESLGKERGRHVTLREIISRPNEAIKFDREHVITAYKGARKILPIPAYVQGERRMKKDAADDEEEGGAVFFFMPRSRRGFFLFFSTPRNSIDRLNPNARWSLVPSTRRSLASFTGKHPGDATLRANNPARTWRYFVQKLTPKTTFPGDSPDFIRRVFYFQQFGYVKNFAIDARATIYSLRYISLN